MLTEIRRQGYAKVDGQVVPGLAAISVPVFDMQEKLIAVIGVLGRMTDEKFFCQSNIDKVQAAALKASNAMGWQPEEMRGDSSPAWCDRHKREPPGRWHARVVRGQDEIGRAHD